MAQFVFPKTLQLWWPCTIRTPIDAVEGQPAWREDTMEMRVTVISQATINEALVKDGVSGLLKQVMTDWRDVVDEDGQPLPFSEFEQLITWPYIRNGLFDAYMDCVRGGPRKN